MNKRTRWGGALALLLCLLLAGCGAREPAAETRNEPVAEPPAVSAARSTEETEPPAPAESAPAETEPAPSEEAEPVPMEESEPVPAEEEAPAEAEPEPVEDLTPLQGYANSLAYSPLLVVLAHLEDRDEQINAAMDWLYSVDWDYRDILHELMTYSEA